jgi:flagellar motility protein MotE (MotC chaperone)
MVENTEENAGTETPDAKPQKSKLPLLTVAIGVLAFVLSMAGFSITMGVFSDSNVKSDGKAPAGNEVASPDEGTDQERAAFDPSYYEDQNREADSSSSDSEDVKMSEQDSLAQMAWYEKQKREIEKERRQLEIDRHEVETLHNETMRLIETRKRIEESNTVEMAKLFDSMKAPEVAAIMQNMTDEQVGSIVMKMKKQNASKVLAALPAERAAKITSQMMNLAEGN